MDGTGSEGVQNTQGAAVNDSSGGSSSAVNSTNSGNSAAANSNAENQRTDNNSTNIEELIQSAVDRATNKLGNENKSLREQLETAKRANMTDAEKHGTVQLRRKGR